MNTFPGGLKGSMWAAERFQDDVMITKLVEGTFYEVLTSEVIIKRRLNEVVIAFYVTGRGGLQAFQKIYFLKGFCERLLTEILGCIVSIEARTGPEK